MSTERATDTRRNAGLRKLLYTPLTVGALAVIVGAGAATPASAIATNTLTKSTDILEFGHHLSSQEQRWELVNATDISIDGLWTQQQGREFSSIEGALNPRGSIFVQQVRECWLQKLLVGTCLLQPHVAKPQRRTFRPASHG